MTTAEPKPTPKERTTVYLPAALRQEIEAAAHVAGQSLSTWVQRALSNALQKVAAQ
jgi:predicted HicB family RNase H-like nuclease